MNESVDVTNFPIVLLIGSAVMVALPVLILCQFKKMEKKKQAVLSVSQVPAAEISDSVRKAMNQNGMIVMGKRKYAERIHNSAISPWTKTNEGAEQGGLFDNNNLKTQESKDRGGRNYQIIGDLETTDSSFEYSLDNTLAMESLDMIKGKHGLILEGEEVDHQMVKTARQSDDSSDYSFFGSQSSRRDIREQRLRLLRLNTSVARRAAAALEDSAFSTSSQDKKDKHTAETDLEVEETQKNLVAHT
uniref:Uncharacterized protein n=1 Tax=Elaeophora elaphi TaxID=1147741 RepID=A0A0R3RFJ7_9BILA